MCIIFHKKYYLITILKTLQRSNKINAYDSKIIELIKFLHFIISFSFENEIRNNHFMINNSLIIIFSILYQSSSN